MSWFDQRPDDAMDGAFTVVGPQDVRTVEPAAFREAYFKAIPVAVDFMLCSP